jgi:IS5 family transposase
MEAQERLYNRRSGIEALISHVKHGGQMRKSRMKTDKTTLSAGYAAVLGFNLRQYLHRLQEKTENKAKNPITCFT